MAQHREGRPLNNSISPIRIVVVDDSALFRLLLSNVVKLIPDCTVVGSAKNGYEAVEQIEKLRPDLVTLDVEMPEMNGIKTLQEIKRRGLTATTIMVSRLTAAGAQTTADALLDGAFDFILKPSGRSPDENKSSLLQSLTEKIAAVRESRSHGGASETSNPEPAPLIDGPRSNGLHLKAVIIGTSTGGPDALRQVLPGLLPNLSVPVVVIQHMPAGYTVRLAQRLNELSPVVVQEAQNGSKLTGGRVLLAPGGKQMKFVRDSSGSISTVLTDDPPEHGCHPAVDYTLRSAVEIFDGQLLTVILTGMGRDGTEGCRLVRSHGGHVIAQHPDGCAVYGMPKSVITNDLANEIVKLNSLSAVINQRIESARSTN